MTKLHKRQQSQQWRSEGWAATKGVRAPKLKNLPPRLHQRAPFWQGMGAKILSRSSRKGTNFEPSRGPNGLTTPLKVKHIQILNCFMTQTLTVGASLTQTHSH